jgi:hypothetical protein
MSQVQDLLLINAVIEAAFGGSQGQRSLPPTGVTRWLFALVAAGERDFETLRTAVLNFSDRDGYADRPSGSHVSKTAAQFAKPHFARLRGRDVTSSCKKLHPCADAQHPKQRVSDPAQ